MEFHHQNAKRLPTINFFPENLKHGSEMWSSTCKDVRTALEEYGCFLVGYDEVPLKLRGSIFSIADQLFDLPIETKAKNTSTTPLFGYLGGIPELPLHESMGIEDATTLKQVKGFCELIWNVDFCGIIHEYAKKLASLEKLVIRMIFESYGLGKLCESHLESTTELLRFNSYRVPSHDETMIGVKLHSDKSFITILDQNQVNGLEVKFKDDQWYSVDFLPSSYVVMAGEGLMAWSKNRIQSIK